jgi:plastocyanin
LSDPSDNYGNRLPSESFRHNDVYNDSLENNNSDNDHQGENTSQRTTERNSSDGPINPSTQNEDPSPYTFNGKVVIGIGIILAVAAAGAISASSASTSSVIRMSSLNPFAPVGLSLQASAQQGQQQSGSSASTHLDKRFILVAHDFGFNGTTGGPAIQVNKGDIVQITFINAGHMAHNFGMAKLSARTSEIMNKTTDVPLDERANSIPYDVMGVMPCPDCQKKFDEGHIETFILPDHQASSTFTANEAGHFKYFCMVRGHIWMGMIGDLIVVNSPSGVAKSSSSAGGTSA